MKKRQTKTEKIEAEKSALRLRLYDLACGAFGQGFTEDSLDDLGGELIHITDIEGFGRWLCAIREVFELNDSVEGQHKAYMTHPQCLHKFATLDSATEFLYERGIRATD
jgi:hypothetical protein